MLVGSIAIGLSDDASDSGSEARRSLTDAGIDGLSAAKCAVT